LIDEIVQKYIVPMAPIPTPLKPTGRLKKKINTVFFDIYGTLFVSGSGDISLAKRSNPKLQKIEQLLIECNILKPPRKLLQELYAAIEATHSDLRNSGIDYPEVNIEQIWSQVLQTTDKKRIRRFAIEFEWIANPVYPMPNLANTLSILRRHDIELGIISNAQFYTPYLFKWFLDSDAQGLGFSLDLVFYSYRFGIAKPSSTLFDLAAKKLKEKGIRTSAALYIGNDMLNDIYPAKMTGFQTALFAGDNRSLRLRSDDSRCRNLNADIVLTDLNQLIDFIH